ncbi:MAG: DUF3995 domain-containing protein [Hyphomicrobiales bacterium]
MPALATILAAVFVVLALLHAYWAFGGTFGKAAAIPEINGAPAFEPSAAGTMLVAAGLLACALVIGIAAGLTNGSGDLRGLAGWVAYGLAAALLLRAVGEFRLVGFFKRVRGSAFSRMDDFVYSPLCVALALAIVVLLQNPGA